MTREKTEQTVTQAIEALVKLLGEQKISPVAITVTGVHPDDGTLFTQAWTGDPSAFVRGGKEMSGPEFRGSICECLIAIAKEIEQHDHVVGDPSLN